MAESKDEANGKLLPNTDPETKSADAYGNLSRGLTSEELAQSGTQKLILNDLAKAESKVRDLEPFVDKYYSVFTEKSVLEEKLLKIKRAEILYTFCITAGGIIIGLAKIFYETTPILCLIMLLIGFLLVLGGVLFKITYKK